MKVAVTGSTGFLGSACVEEMKKQNWEVVRIVRPQTDTRCFQKETMVLWDPKRACLDSAQLEGCEAILHLAGANIAARRWTPLFQEELRRSRVDATRFLVEKLKRLKRPPKVFVSASAVGFYGDTGEREVQENDPPGMGFLAFLAQEWEAQAKILTRVGVRVVLPRFSLVLHPSGGALRPLWKATRFGFGAVLGHGRQWMSWIALSDAVRAVLEFLQKDSWKGPVNLCSPYAVRHEMLVKTIGRVLRRPVFLRIPTFALKMLFGPMAREALLASSRVVPTRLTQSGFRWEYPHLEPYLKTLTQAAKT